MKTRANKLIHDPTPIVGNSQTAIPQSAIRNPQSATRLRSSGYGATSPQSAIRNPQSAIPHSPAIALVITLLMLSVITFLAVAFLVLTRAHREQVNASADIATAQDMSRAALARAQSQIIARMKAHGDILNYDYAVPHNFINPNGFVLGLASDNNVNYDYYSTGSRMSSTVRPQDWAQNIANLWLDPRPPVFVKVGTNTDFRFWLDLNRNGKFETNGYLPFIGDNGLPLINTNGIALTNYFNGEPEWIGVLQYPELPHSATNRFIGRYTYVALPIGKTLDFNYIHNYSKYIGGGVPSVMQVPGSQALGQDGFVRDQGVGSWELNLAGFFWGLDTNFYANTSTPYFATPYNYILGTSGSTAVNRGYVFDDAYAFLRFRYAGTYGPLGSLHPPLSLNYFFGSPASRAPNYLQDGIDEYGILGVPFPINNYPSSAVGFPWPGSFDTNNFYAIQDLFDTNKTSPGFTNRLFKAGSFTNSYDRYMFQRLLAGIGAGSAPELQTWVYADGITTNPAVQPPTLLRPKVNINYDNTRQIAGGLNASPTNLIPWTAETNGNPFGFPTNGALGFFTNAAESLLRSQNFRITNYFPNGNVNLTNPISYLHFGLTNIPIYNSTNPSIRYTEQIHRMLQLAANIYDATRTDTVVPPGALPYPSVFRPLFAVSNYNATNHALFIVGYANVTNDAYSRISSMTNTNSLTVLKLPSATNIAYNDNVWGIPWVIGAVKGLPAFDRFVADTSWIVTRKLLFVRVPYATNRLFGESIRASSLHESIPHHVHHQYVWHGCMECLPVEYHLSVVQGHRQHVRLHPAYQQLGVKP